MNDRFKFRFWDSQEKAYTYKLDIFDFTSDIRDIFDSMYMNHEEGNGYLINGDRIIEQCTGLKDENGILIYEGDIVREVSIDEDSAMGAEFEEVSVVCFGGGDYPYSFTLKHPRFYRGYALLNYGYMRQDIEVIGNIHENHELLEQNNDNR